MTEGYTYVLIVEDDAQLNAVMRQTLELERFGTVAAYSGEEGWSNLVREHPAVAIVDLGLPGDSGWSLIQRMRGDGRFAGIPILVVTGDPDEHIEERPYVSVAKERIWAVYPIEGPELGGD